jgi:hypothetical protein
MNRREKILAAAVLLLVVLGLGKWGFSKYHGGLEKRIAARDDARQRLMAVDRQLAQGRAAVRQMEDWQARSLPADQETAMSLYKAWLLEKAKAAGLEETDIKPSSRPSGLTAYKTVGYTVTAKGTLSEVAAMLYEIYHSPQLHQVVKLQMDRTPTASQVGITLELEALSLPGAVETNKLPEGDSKRLKLAKVDDYKKTFEERDLANVYKPPAPPRPPVAERRDPPAPPKFDDAEQARFSASMGPADSLQAWVLVQTTGETLHLGVGDPLKVGALDAKVVSIEKFALVYETDGKKFRVPLGKFLREAKELPADASTSAEKPEKSPES